MVDESLDLGLPWQVGIWDRMSDIYQREIDARQRRVALVEQPTSVVVGRVVLERAAHERRMIARHAVQPAAVVARLVVSEHAIGEHRFWGKMARCTSSRTHAGHISMHR